MNLQDNSLFREAAYLAGAWISTSSSMHEVLNPANGDRVGKVPNLVKDQIELAIREAQRTFESWREFTGKERSVILKRWADLMHTNMEDLAQILTAEQGKPLQEARGEIAYAASFVEWFAEEAKRGYGNTIPEPKRGQRITVIKEPIGVCAAITPWNFPSAMVTRKVAPAIAAGCTVLLKPAPQTPFSAMALCVLAGRAGIPKGVLSVITGDAVMIGKTFCESTVVRKISFTGSTAVGKILMQQASSTVKKLSLELGGNAPFIVFDDADLDAAVSGAMSSKFRNAGQTCVCVNRFLVQRSVYDKFIQKLSKEVIALKVGVGTKEGVTIGPLVNQEAVLKVESLISDAVAQGAVIEASVDTSYLSANRYCAPSVISGVTPKMRISQEEIFGPIATVIAFDTEAEAISIANATRYGLAAYAYTNDLNRSHRLARALEFGILGINEGLVSTEVAPFGGLKESGFGKEGSFYGFEEYLDSKYVCHGGVS